MDKDKSEKKDILDEKIRQLEDKILKERPNDEAKFKILKDEILNL